MEKSNKYNPRNFIDEFLETINAHRKIINEVVESRKQLNDAIAETTKELSSRLSDIDWDETMRIWRDSAEKLGERGWTFPLSMTPGEVIELCEAEDIDAETGGYFGEAFGLGGFIKVEKAKEGS